MANIGDILTSPETGWQRIDDTNLNISYDSSWYRYSSPTSEYNATIMLTETVNSSCIFYFYGTQLRIIDTMTKKRDSNVQITIDEVEENYSAYTSSTSGTYQVLVYEKLDLDKGIHKVKIKKISNDATKVCLDAIDIDEDGYMVYCDDNGKLYYDVTPIMTSNTTPSPYVVSYSSVFADKYNAFQAFDGATYGDNTSFAPNANNGWLCLDFGNKIKSNAFIIGTGSKSFFGKEAYPKSIELSISDNNIEFSPVENYTNIKEWTMLENRKFMFNTQNSRFYKINVPLIGNAQYLNIAELRYLLAVETPFYLIQDNTNGKKYNYDEENNQLVEVTDTSILHKDALNNTCIYDLNKVLPLLDTLSDDLTILSNKDKKIIAKGLKVNTSMIIAKTSFSTRLAKNIDFFELISNISETSSIKMAVSVDEGLTWKTWSESGFIDLTNTCPLKEYSALSEDEKIQWNTFKDEVYASGINGKTLNTVDFNSIKEENMMFAYVFNRDSYEDKCEMSKLQYQFDAKGSYILLKDSEVDIKQNSEGIGITPKNDMELMKVNVGSSGEVNIIQNGGSANFESATSTDIQNILSKGW